MASIFPVVPSDIPRQAADSIAASLDFDMERREFVVVDGAPRTVSGPEAVRQWFAIMLRQQPDAVPIYRTGTTVPGVSRAALGQHGLPQGYYQAEIERTIRDTASFCPAVRSVGDFEFTREGRTLLVTFTAWLHTGESLEVTADVGE